MERALTGARTDDTDTGDGGGRPGPSVARLRSLTPRLLLLVPLLLYGIHATVYLMPFEDAYISYRYAENLAAGEGLVFNAGERVEGYTSFGWVLILAAADSLGADLPTAAVSLSFLLGFVLVGVTWFAARRWTGGGWRVALGASILVAAHGTLAYYAMTGMETTLFAVLVCAALLLAAAEDGRHIVAAGVVLGLAAMVRPEGLGYAGLAVIALLLHRDSRRRAGTLALVFALIFVPYFLWRLSYFGYLAPNTYYAKASPSALKFQVGLAQIEQFATLTLFWLVLPAFVLLRGQWSRPWVRLAVVSVFGAGINVVLVGGDIFSFYRFMLPVIPVGCVALAAATGPLMRRWPRGPAGLVPLALLVGLAGWTWAADYVPRHTLSGDAGMSNHARVVAVHRLNQQYFAVGHWLRENVDEDATLAVNAAGIVPYVSGLRTIDMCGLTDVHIAHREVPHGVGAMGHEKHDAGYVLDRQPDLIIPGLPVLTRGPVEPARIAPHFGRFFQDLPGDHELLTEPRISKEYDVVSVPVDAERWLTFFVRVSPSG